MSPIEPRLWYGTLVTGCGRRIPGVAFPDVYTITGMNVQNKDCIGCEHFTKYNYGKYIGYCKSVTVEDGVTREVE